MFSDIVHCIARFRTHISKIFFDYMIFVDFHSRLNLALGGFANLGMISKSPDGQIKGISKKKAPFEALW